MAIAVVQAGSALYKINPDTGAATALSLPSGVTLSTTRKPRFAVMNQWVVLVNSPSRNLAIDPEGVVRVLVPRPPVSSSISAASGTGLTGAYKVRWSFVVYDTGGNLLMESPLGPPSISLTLSNQGLALTRIPTSEDTISARRGYRTAAGGSEYYNLMDVDGNVMTSAITNLADAALALLPVESSALISPPGTLQSDRLRNICSWKNRLWGTGAEFPDTIYYTENGLVYAWPNALTAFPTGVDAEGVVAFAPRENELGILKRNGLWQITGDSDANFSIVQITQGKDATAGMGGCVAPDSVSVIGDKVYWLGRDGVYEWGQSLQNISDAEVAPWFKSDTYFDRSVFSDAFAYYNEIRHSYDLYMKVAGASTIKWVSFNLRNRKWYGPHTTSLFTPSAAIQGLNGTNQPVGLVGGTDGIVYTANSTNARDGSATAIDMDVYGRFHSGNAPDIFHHWGRMSILTKIQSGGQLSIIPYLGGLNASAGTTKLHDMTLGREVLTILGNERMCRLRFRQNTVDVPAVIYGYEIPNHEIARR